MNFRRIDMMKHIYNYINQWKQDTQAIAAVEASLIFPVLLVILVGTFDLGYGILAAQKNIRASQVTADLVTRGVNINATGVQEAYKAGELALQPLDTTSYGVDIISFRFDDEENPEIVWRETINMSPTPGVEGDVAALAEPGGGVVMVVSKYKYEPLFAGFVIDDIQMEERAFARGRRSTVVNYDDT
jgi:hypothetical protein